MRILVTGAAGLIGSAVADDWLAIMTSSVSTWFLAQRSYWLPIAMTWRSGVGSSARLMRSSILPRSMRRMSVERSDSDFKRSNVEATSRLLDLALEAGVSHFVLTSTTSLYGHALEGGDRAVWVDELLEPAPRDIYDETKLEAEQLVAKAGGSMTVTSLRMSRCFPGTGRAPWPGIASIAESTGAMWPKLMRWRWQGRAARPRYVISSASPFLREDCEALATNAPAVIERRCPGLIDRMTARGWRAPVQSTASMTPALRRQELGFAPRHGIRVLPRRRLGSVYRRADATSCRIAARTVSASP